MNDELKNREIEELLAGYFSGNIPEEDRGKVEKWRDSSPDNRKLFDGYLATWKISGKPEKLLSIDLETEWKHLKSLTIDREVPVKRIQEAQGKVIPIWLKVAASLMLTVIAGYIIYTVYQARNTYTLLSGNAIKIISLPDGTRVTLNRNASLVYHKNFDRKDRRVFLTGEAFFDVVHDPLKKFIVSTRLARVEVTGTSFNVNAPDNRDSVEVDVSQGTVAVSGTKEMHNKILLKMGNRGIVDGKNGTLVKLDSVDMNTLAWKTGKLFFNNDSLGYVVAMLNNTYTSRIMIKNSSLIHCRITASFDNQSLVDILEIIKSTLGLSVTKKNNIYIIDGPGC